MLGTRTLSSESGIAGIGGAYQGVVPDKLLEGGGEHGGVERLR